MIAAPSIVVDALTAADWPAVRAIFEDGIATGDATFEISSPSWEEWDAGHLADHRLAARTDDKVVGWAALTPISDRCVYAGVAELSVYVGARARGCGVGRALLEALIRSAETGGIWTLQADVFPENHVSIELHRRLGFRVVGIRERLGKHGDAWRDVVLLERRSEEVD